MDVIIMPSTASLIPRLKTDYPQFLFKKASHFLWSPGEQAIYYTAEAKGCSFLLHELSHGLLRHMAYNYDVELIAMERAAWDKASKLAELYNVIIDDTVIQSTLDTYRDWLHSRSTCPNCQAIGLQVKKRVYSCLA